MYKTLKVTKLETECWEWTGGRVGGRYGKVWFGKKHWLVHRLAWVWVNGEIPEGKLLCHRCDNTVCYRPDHMFLGTHKDNSQDCVKKDRCSRLVTAGSFKRGEGHPMSRLTMEDIAKMKLLWSTRLPGKKQPCLTQAQIGDMFGIKNNTVSMIVSGHRW